MNNQSNKIQTICVFTGSSPGSRTEYGEAAVSLGKAIAQRGIGLVYGGANVGLMGMLADSVLKEGGHVTGVMPQVLVDKEVAHSGLSEIHVVSDMHERKAMMSQLSNAFIALPGGLGTLEELFEILTWGQLGFHNKACCILDVCDYYSDLLSFLNKAVLEGFIKEAHKSMLLVESSPNALLDRIERYSAPKVSKLGK